MSIIKATDKFTFKLDVVNKKFHIKGVGSISNDDAEYFLSEYNKSIKLIKSSEYELLFDCTELRVSGKDMKSGTDMTQILKACLELYKKDSFKNVIFDCKGNLTTGMQLNRLGKEVGLISFQVLK